MKSFIRTAAALLATSALYLTSAQASARVDVSIGINVPPPIHHVEIAPAQRHGYIWAPGYWHWKEHRHTWVEGRWIKARPGYRRAPERWEQRGDRHHFVPARWERDRGNRHESRHEHDRGYKHHHRN